MELGLNKIRFTLLPLHHPTGRLFAFLFLCFAGHKAGDRAIIRTSRGGAVLLCRLRAMSRGAAIIIYNHTIQS